ncbi:imidazole glycerol phosphate synthase subunit HisF [Ancylomarina sp. DW003]|nr:imidazole glycerol phosphate synthase subunit HisF [Ancylomarina sp. DW003]MDE5424125.1 imidazole glycerol phosphate synthase subunit HisF [Ancylomarina sp. DW003]
MLAKRIIPCLDIKDGRTVKGINFVDLKDAGDPVELAKAYAEQGADELVFLDITATHEKRKPLLDMVAKVAQVLNIPFTVGGGISSCDDVDQILKAGADKIAINSSAIRNPELITELANRFGSQCVVLAVDARETEKDWEVYLNGGRIPTGIKLYDWLLEAERRGAGEILFTSMNHDGTKNGFANKALAKISQMINIPLIASGGAGCMKDFADTFTEGKADAALAASVFHYKEIEIPELKQFLRENNIPVRL